VEIAWGCASVTPVRWMQCTKRIAPPMFEITMGLTAGGNVHPGLVHARAIVASMADAVGKAMTTSVAPAEAETVTIHVP